MRGEKTIVITSAENDAHGDIMVRYYSIGW